MKEKIYKLFETTWKEIAVSESQGQWRVRLGEKIMTLEPLLQKPPMYTFLVEGHQVLELEIHADASGDMLVNLGHYPYRFHLVDPSRVALENAERESGKCGGNVIAPMPGKVVEIKVKVGDDVAPGQAVIVVEAMKMQNALTAEGQGSVREIPVAVGQTVESGQLLLRIEA